MKHLRLILIMLVCLILTASTLAQDATAEATQDAPSDVTVNTGADGSVDITVESPPPAPADTFPTSYLLSGLLVVSILFSGYAMRLLSTFIHPDMAKTLIQAGVQLGLAAGRNEAAKTEGALDDQLIEFLAGNQGYEFVQRPDGTYEVKVKTAEIPASQSISVSSTSGPITTTVTHAIPASPTSTPSEG
jgi:hypothetical protein